jgi:hypothetical protein
MAKATGSAPLAWKCVHQLQALFRTLPIEIAVSGITQFVAGEFAPESFQAAVQILGSPSGDAPELRNELSDGARQFLRHYLSNGIAKVLANDLFDDETRAYAAIALARVGEANDLACLRSFIDADIRRLKPRATNYSNWHVQALMTLEAPDVDAVLIDLLREQKYEGWAAQSLLQLVVPPNLEKKPWLGNEIDYEAIWTARAGTRPPGFDEGRARRYAQVIKQRLLELAGEHATAAKPERFAGRL